MNASQVSAFAARTQTVMEDVYPCTLTIVGQAYEAARGAWRNVEMFDEQLQVKVEVRLVQVRVRKALLQADGREPRSGGSTVIVDGVTCTLIAVKAGPSDPAWVLTCEASGSAVAQG